MLATMAWMDVGTSAATWRESVRFDFMSGNDGNGDALYSGEIDALLGACGLPIPERKELIGLVCSCICSAVNPRCISHHDHI
jgi:hypothetical protein